MKRILAGLLTLVIASAVANGQSDSVDAASCLGRWSPPFPIQRADGRPVYVEQGVVTALDNRSLALGAPTFFWMARQHMAPPELHSDTAGMRWAFTRGGALFDSAGIAAGVRMMDTTRRHGDPRLAGWSNGRVIIAWTANDSVLDWDAEPDHVDVASFDGTIWSVPQPIIRAPRLLLHHTPAMRAGAAFSHPVIAVTSLDSTGAFIRIARRHGDRWAAIDWRSQVFMHYGAVAVDIGADSVLVVMMTVLRTGNPGVYSTVGEWRGDGAVWSPLQLVDSLTDHFQMLSAARLDGDSLVIAWPVTSERGPNAIVTALSVDAGRSWSVTDTLRLRSGANGVRLTVDDAGDLHLVYAAPPEAEAQLLGAPGMIMHAHFMRGGWTAPRAISQSPSVTEAAVGPAPGGGLIAIWTETRAVPEGEIPRSLASRWTRGCVRD